MNENSRLERPTHKYIIDGEQRPNLDDASPVQLLHAFSATCIWWGRSSQELAEIQTECRVNGCSQAEEEMATMHVKARDNRAIELRKVLLDRLMPLLNQTT